MSADLLPFTRSIEHVSDSNGRGADLYLECGHKTHLEALYVPGIRAIPCAQCVERFHEEQERRRIDRMLYTILQECRVWIMQTCARPAGTDTMRRLDESLETLRRRVENPQE